MTVIIKLAKKREIQIILIEGGTYSIKLFLQLLNLFICFCLEIRCDPPTVTNGTYYPKKKVFRELEVIRVDCNKGFHFETDNRERRAECTKNGWLPIPRCICKFLNILKQLSKSR